MEMFKDLMIFLGVLSVLIITHEYGHFIIARRRGVRVEKFSIGFGPVIFKRIFKDTEFLISLIPLGGYVKLAGDERKEYKGEDDEFLSKPPGIRAQVIVAGPLFNYLFSFLLIWFLFTIGMPQPEYSKESVVGAVIKDSPAEKVGIKAKDRIVAIDDEPIDSWERMVDIIRGSKDKLKITLEREGKRITVYVKPQLKETKDMFGRKQGKVPQIGIGRMVNIKIVRYNPFLAFYYALRYVFLLTLLIIKGFFYIATRAVPMQEALAGPIALYQITAEIAAQGLRELLNLISVVGISLGIVNLFPIPVLDGGHLFLLAIEKVRKKPLKEHTEDLLIRIGIVVISILIFVVFYNDIMRIITNRMGK